MREERVLSECQYFLIDKESTIIEQKKNFFLYDYAVTFHTIHWINDALT